LIFSSSNGSPTAGAQRTATLATTQNKRYFLFEASSINARWYSTTTDFADFDNLVAVPEPATLAFLALGGIWLGRRKNSR